MHKVLVILRKEFMEIVQQRILLFSILLPSLLFVVIPLIFLQRVGNGSKASSLNVPSLQGLTLHEYTQGVVGTLFSNIFLLLSMIVPSTIAPIVSLARRPVTRWNRCWQRPCAGGNCWRAKCWRRCCRRCWSPG